VSFLFEIEDLNLPCSKKGICSPIKEYWMGRDTDPNKCAAPTNLLQNIVHLFIIINRILELILGDVV